MRFPRKRTPKYASPSEDYLEGFKEAEEHYKELVSWCRDYIELLEKKLHDRHHGGDY